MTKKELKKELKNRFPKGSYFKYKTRADIIKVTEEFKIQKDNCHWGLCASCNGVIVYTSRTGEFSDRVNEDGTKYVTPEPKLKLAHSNVDKSEGIKEKDGKLFYELDWRFVEAMAIRMQENKGDKYPPFNWKKPINKEDLIQAINRHHIEVMDGNYSDGDREFGHIEAYACNAMMLWHQLKNKIK